MTRMSGKEPKPLTESEIQKLVQEDSEFAVPNLGQILEGKTAIITGCSSGLGAATTKTFLTAGANVVGCYYSKADAKVYKENAIGDVKRFAEKYAGRFIAFNLDIADKETPKTLVEAAISNYGRITTLCNIAGIADFADFENMSREQYDRTLKTNLTGHVFLAKDAIGHMKENPIVNGSRGSIINFSSVAGLKIGEEGVLPYAITKGAMHSFTLELAIELGKYKIRANSVVPGSITTPINYRDLGDPARKEGIEKRTALGRWGYPQEIANVNLFLASDLSSYITGESILVDGGLTSTFKL